MKNTYVRINTSILDNYRIASLPDDEWREYIEEIAHDPKNIKFDPGPQRQEWNGIRKTVSPRIIQNGSGRCAYCGSTEKLEIDHIIPLARGGTNDSDNLQVLCRSCNRRKGVRI